MAATDTDDFDRRYQSHLKHLKMQGTQPKTIDACARGIRRMGEYFDHQIDSPLSIQWLVTLPLWHFDAITGGGVHPVAYKQAPKSRAARSAGDPGAAGSPSFDALANESRPAPRSKKTAPGTMHPRQFDAWEFEQALRKACKSKPPLSSASITAARPSTR